MQGGAPASNDGRVGPVGFRTRGLEARKQVCQVLEADSALAAVYLSGDQAALDEGTVGRLRVRSTSTKRSHAQGFCSAPRGWLRVFSLTVRCGVRQISHVVNATTHVPDAFPQRCRYLRVPILDVHSKQHDDALLALLPSVVEFVAAARRDGTGVLIHCLWGISRSVALLLAYMISPQVSASTLPRIARALLRGPLVAPRARAPIHSFQCHVGGWPTLATPAEAVPL